MKTVIKIEGMRCKHCEAHVTDTLKNFDGIDSVKVSLKNKEAIIKHKNPIENETIKNLISSIGYEVIDITQK